MTKTAKLSLFIFILALLIRLPLISTNFYRTPDAVEYLNPAFNLINEKGFNSTLKVTFLNPAPLPHSAIGERPIGFSLFLTPFLIFNQSPHFIQTILLILHSVNAALLFLLFRHFLSLNYAFLAGLFFGLNPNILITNKLNHSPLLLS